MILQQPGAGYSELAGKIMRVEIISTGDEVITGFITDTNAAWLCQELLVLGIQARRRQTVGDSTEDIAEVIRERSAAADLLFVNGGLGPTTDDNTSAAAALAAGVKLVRHEEWVARIRRWHTERGRIMPESNLKQADLPEGAELLDNPGGTACGFSLKINRARCFFTPGVPREFNQMFKAQILPRLKQHLTGRSGTRVKRLLLTGISESALQMRMNAITMPQGTVLGYRAAFPELELKIIAHDAAPKECERLIANVRSAVLPYLVCEDQLDVVRWIGQSAGTAAVAVFDNVSSGKLAADLALGLQLACALVSGAPLSAQDEKFLDGHNWAYKLMLEQEIDGFVRISLECRASGEVRKYRTRISLTSKERAAATYSLMTEALFLRMLQHRESLRPDNGILEEL